MAVGETPVGPGKTPPRLIADLLDYVPRLGTDGYNLLADPAPQFRNKPIYRKGWNDCRHQIMRKNRQTKTPIPGGRMKVPSSSFVSAICSECRHHFRITIFYCSGQNNVLCNTPQSENPLHHLIFKNSTRAVDQAGSTEVSKYDGHFEIFEYRCSGFNCSFVVKIKIIPPRLDNDLLKLLDDETMLEARGIKEINKDPLRFIDYKPVDSFQALKNLGSYLDDALKTLGEPRKIAIRNKKYRLSFADDCSDIFRYLDFTFLEEDNKGDDTNCFWRLPYVTDQNREFIDDVLHELSYKARKKQTQPNCPFLLPSVVPAIRQIKILLGYANISDRTRNFEAGTEEHPYYASLGAIEFFSDKLLSWAYDRQCDCDPVNKPYYFDCLEDLAYGRKSPFLQKKISLAISSGHYGTKAIQDAYNFFALDPDTKESDDYLIGLYQARIKLKPYDEEMARSCLEKIARHRNSSILEAFKNEKTVTYDEALKYLCVDSETPSEFIEASAVVMFVDGDKTRVASALATIAKKKPGDRILQRAAARMASELSEVTLSIDDAYKRLQIPSHEISDEDVLNYFQSLSNGAAAGFRDIFIEAVRVIALERKSAFLLAKLEDPNTEFECHKSEPLGLDNIGNTCYLNSLLQYYYSVKPLRDMIMDFDRYRMVLNDENLRKKKVGGRQVEKAEVIKAQKFVEELRKLFISLKTAKSSSVRPSRELAALTIFGTQTEQAARKNSIGSSNNQTNDQILSKSHNLDPQLPSPKSLVEDDVEMIENIKDKLSEKADSCSEVTLVDSDVSFHSSTEIFSHPRSSNPNYLVKEQNVAQLPDFERDAVTIDSVSNLEPINTVSKPDRPPPIPPRGNSESVISENEIKDIDSAGRLWDIDTQQDVTEVIGNVLFRLQCAITATDYEYPSGEQIDIIREIFYGTNTVYTQKVHSLQKKVEAWSYLLVFPAKSVPRSIYEALDVSFDEQMVEIDKQQVPQFTSISKLPQILQFHIQRTAFDQENLRSWKNRTPVTIPETLYLDRYMDDTDNPNSTILSRRRETWIWKKQLTRLEARYEALAHVREELSVSDALITTKDWVNMMQEVPIEGITIDPCVSSLLESRISEIGLELYEISGEIGTLQQKLQNQFTDMCEYKYSLHAVFIHHGETGGGHYWVYIYDSKNDTWRQYNDENVTEVKNRDFIFKHESVGGGTPYYVVYVRSSLQQELVDPVFRDSLHEGIVNFNDFPADHTFENDLMANGVDKVDRMKDIEHAGQRALQNNMSTIGTGDQW